MLHGNMDKPWFKGTSLKKISPIIQTLLYSPQTTDRSSDTQDQYPEGYRLHAFVDLPATLKNLLRRTDPFGSRLVFQIAQPGDQKDPASCLTFPPIVISEETTTASSAGSRSPR
jgi:hypothetical protein